MHIIYEIKDRMEDELKRLNKKETWTCDDVAIIGEMMDYIKDVETVDAMKNYESQDWMRGYSRGYDADYSMTGAPYGRNGGSYGRDFYDRESYARGRDSMGRYTSRNDEKQDMIDHLNKMMMNAHTPEERESYRSAIEHMSRN